MAMAVAQRVSAMRTAGFFATRGAEAGIEAARLLLRRAGGPRRWRLEISLDEIERIQI